MAQITSYLGRKWMNYLVCIFNFDKNIIMYKTEKKELICLIKMSYIMEVVLK